jgi:hypothetical protein
MRANPFRMSLFGLAFVVIAPMSLAGGQTLSPELIGGIPVSASRFPEVIQVTSEGKICTATVVGPRTILMAAHCISEKNPLVEFKMEGRLYQAMGIRSPYLKQNHNLALGVVFQSTLPVRPASIGGSASIGREILFLGYGSNRPDCQPQAEKHLRLGDAYVSELTDLEMLSSNKDVAFCEDDGGSPAFLEDFPQPVVIGVGNRIKDPSKNRFSRTDSRESQQFFRDVATNYGLDICGITVDCSQ